jgi:hypothetical protein
LRAAGGCDGEIPLPDTAASRAERGTRRRDISLCWTRNGLRARDSLGRIIPGISDLVPSILPVGVFAESRIFQPFPDVASHVASPCQPQCQQICDGREAEVLNDGFGSKSDLRHRSGLGRVSGGKPTFSPERRLGSDADKPDQNIAKILSVCRMMISSARAGVGRGVGSAPRG